MPIYEYRCTACGRQFEVMQKMSDKPLTKCEECSGKLEKLISRTAFQLSGGGWYKSGYTKSGGSSESKPAGESTTTTGVVIRLIPGGRDRRRRRASGNR